MWKSASASGSPWSRLTAVSLLMVSSVRTVGASGMSCVSCSARCVPDSSTRMSSGIAPMFGARMRPVSDSESIGCAQTIFALFGEAAQVVVELGRLALAARLGEHQAEDQQQQCAGDQDPIVEERVDQRRALAFGRRGRSAAARASASAAGVSAGVWRRLRRRRAGFGRSGFRRGRHGLGLRQRLFHWSGLAPVRLRGAAAAARRPASPADRQVRYCAARACAWIR